MIIPSEQGAVAQGRGEGIKNSAFGGDDGLHLEGGSQAGQPLDAPEHRGERVSDAIYNIAPGVGRDGFLQG